MLAKLDYLLEDNFEINDQILVFLTEFFKELKVDNFVESGIYKMENCKKPNSVEGDLARKTSLTVFLQNHISRVFTLILSQKILSNSSENIDKETRCMKQIVSYFLDLAKWSGRETAAYEDI